MTLDVVSQTKDGAAAERQTSDVALELTDDTTTTREKISAYLTIAAAAFGLISDGC